MRQAIEERFILDVLQHYTTYKTYWKLLKTTADDPQVPKRPTAAKLARFVSFHSYNLSQKTEVIIEHFREHVRHKLGGRAKAMVVTASRLHAVRYRQAFAKYLGENGYTDIGVLVAFSGQVEDPDIAGESFTEVRMNDGLGEKELPGRFDEDGIHFLIVANKYQTGFDQPLLHTMYVDKRLSGVRAVQTLSRLNRTLPGKEDTFVLDFVNEADDIRRAFQPYYETVTVEEPADVHRLYELWNSLNAAQVYTPEEVDGFCKLFYAPSRKQKAEDHAQMYRLLEPGVERFKALDDAAQLEFRDSLSAFVRLYSFLSQIIPFTDEDLEKLHSFGRYLEMKLPVDPRRQAPNVDAETTLTYYRLQKISEGPISLVKGQEGTVKGPTDVGTRWGTPETVKLSEVIDVLNERFGLDPVRWTPNER